jgi:hypothetical protein
MFSWFFPFCSGECFPDSSMLAFFSWVIINGFLICYFEPLPQFLLAFIWLKLMWLMIGECFTDSSFFGWSLIDLNIMPKTPISAFDESDLEF